MGGGFRGTRTSYSPSRVEGQGSKFYSPNSRLDNYAADGSKPPVVFISFHSEDEDQVNLLRHQAKDDRFNLEFTDYSIKEPYEEKWKTQTTERIKRSDVFVVMIGPDTYSRDAVNWEIEKAYELGKKVVGVRIYRDENHKIPESMERRGARVINWNVDELNRVINDGS